MVSLHWFSGAKERKAKALELLDQLVNDLNTDENNRPLQCVLLSYRQELETDFSAVQYILSRMFLEISQVIRDNHLKLTKSQENLFSELRKILQIRYGY